MEGMALPEYEDAPVYVDAPLYEEFEYWINIHMFVFIMKVWLWKEKNKRKENIKEWACVGKWTLSWKARKGHESW